MKSFISTLALTASIAQATESYHNGYGQSAYSPFTSAHPNANFGHHGLGHGHNYGHNLSHAHGHSNGHGLGHVQKAYSSTPPVEKYEQWSDFTSLTAADFENDIIHDDEFVWVVAFVARTCHTCHGTAEEFKQLRDLDTIKGYPVKFGYVDITGAENKDILDNYCGDLDVYYTPSVLVYGKDKHNPVEYTGDYKHASMDEYVCNQCDVWGYEKELKGYATCGVTDEHHIVEGTSQHYVEKEHHDSYDSDILDEYDLGSIADRVHGHNNGYGAPHRNQGYGHGNGYGNVRSYGSLAKPVRQYRPKVSSDYSYGHGNVRSYGSVAKPIKEYRPKVSSDYGYNSKSYGYDSKPYGYNSKPYGASRYNSYRPSTPYGGYGVQRPSSYQQAGLQKPQRPQRSFDAPNRGYGQSSYSAYRPQQGYGNVRSYGSLAKPVREYRPKVSSDYSYGAAPVRSYGYNSKPSYGGYSSGPSYGRKW